MLGVLDTRLHGGLNGSRGLRQLGVSSAHAVGFTRTCAASGWCVRDVVEALAEDEVHLGVRDDVELVVPDRLEHLVCDRGGLQAGLQEVAHHRFIHLLALSVRYGVDGSGEVGGPVSGGVWMFVSTQPGQRTDTPIFASASFSSL